MDEACKSLIKAARVYERARQFNPDRRERVLLGYVLGMNTSAIPSIKDIRKIATRNLRDAIRALDMVNVDG